MKFLISGRGFILPAVAGVVLLGRNWFPHATIVCMILNFAALFLIAVDYFLLPHPRSFVISRILPPHFFLGVEETVTIRIEYSVPLPLTLQFVDHPPGEFRYDDRRFFLKLTNRNGYTDFSYQLTALRRGQFTFGAAGLRIATPFGLVYRQAHIPIDDVVKVYPVLPTEKEGLQSKFYMARTESRQMKTYGPGREFSQLRDYRRGDDIKNIHWKKSARCGKYVVKEYTPELGQNIFIVIDGGRLMMAETAGRSKVDWAVGSAISLAREALSMKDAVGVMAFSNQVETFLMPSNKQVQLTSLVRSIYAFQPRFIEPDYGTAFAWLHQHTRDQSIIVIYTDFIDPFLSKELAAGVAHLKKRHRVICCALGFEGLETLGYTACDTLSESIFASVVRDSIYNRKHVLEELGRAGVDVIDVHPEKLCASVLNGYINARWK